MVVFSCSENASEKNSRYQAVYVDKPYIQDYSIKFYSDIPDTKLLKVVSGRNGIIKVLSSSGLLKPHTGQLLYPGTLVKDLLYRPLSDKKISAITTHHGEIIYSDKNAIFSNDRAGKLYVEHNLTDVSVIATGPPSSILISDGRKLVMLHNNKIKYEISLPGDKIKDIRYSERAGSFLILTGESVYTFSPESLIMEKIISGTGFNCFEVSGNKIITGTSAGYMVYDLVTGRQEKAVNDRLPWNEITAIREINGNIWFGSTRGAFMLGDDGKFSYYSSERWLPSDSVADITDGPDNSVLILTSRGLAKICFEKMTLHDKAIFFEKQVRDRHIRYGFNSTLVLSKKGNLSTGSLEDSDNDGLWTSLYLAAETFRYSVTRSPEALQNISESLEAMERLFTINPVPGFPARSFERSGYYRHDPGRWMPSPEPGWHWKATTSSDEAIGHIFAYGVIAELVDEPSIRIKAVELIDTLMSHIVKNNFYLVDYDGKPTRWGRWNPEYVNALHPSTGDRKLNSSNIISMLQTAYHFTKKEQYRNVAFYLMREHGYLENLMRPMKDIGQAPPDADELSRMLSDSWNHSDDEMYFCGYWGLYRYAFNDTLKNKFREAIIDHWQAERPEKEGLWNIMTAVTGSGDYDLMNAIWYLQEYPLDLIDWSVKNSHRKDIEMLDHNFRNQTIREVLPPDELKISRHNTNRFVLDGGNDGMSEMSAGDIWLLPYWMGRYLGVISPPAQ